jgi:hypothetical protein
VVRATLMAVPPRMPSTALHRPGAGRGWRPGQISRSLPHGYVGAVLDTIRQLGLEQLIDAAGGRQRDLVTAMITAAVIDGSPLSGNVRPQRDCDPITRYANVLKCVPAVAFDVSSGRRNAQADSTHVLRQTGLATWLRLDRQTFGSGVDHLPRHRQTARWLGAGWCRCHQVRGLPRPGRPGSAGPGLRLGPDRITAPAFRPGRYPADARRSGRARGHGL